MALKIAFLAWNHMATTRYFQQLLADNAEQVDRYDRRCGRAWLKDGTVITAIPIGHHPAGYHFDQVIIADDRRLNTLGQRRAELREMDRSCQGSNIPEEFRYQIYDLDAEAPT